MIDAGSFALAAGKIQRQPLVEFGIDQQSELSIHEIGKVGHRHLERIHGKGNVTTIKMATMQHQFGFTIDQRIIVGAVKFVLDVASHPAQGIAKHTDHMRRTANRVTILQADHFRCIRVQISINPGRSLVLPGMWFGGEEARVEMTTIAAQGDR